MLYFCRVVKIVTVMNHGQVTSLIHLLSLMHRRKMLTIYNLHFPSLILASVYNFSLEDSIKVCSTAYIKMCWDHLLSVHFLKGFFGNCMGVTRGTSMDMG